MRERDRIRDDGRRSLQQKTPHKAGLIKGIAMQLQSEANTEFVDAAFLLNTDKGGQEVVVEFPACREDEELLLATNRDVTTETVDVGDFVDVEAGGYTEVETTLVVL